MDERDFSVGDLGHPAAVQGYPDVDVFSDSARHTVAINIHRICGFQI